MEESTPSFPSEHLLGACEGTLACSTCHMIVDPQWYPKIPDPITEEEHDMLDLAFGLTETYVCVFRGCFFFLYLNKYGHCTLSPESVS